MYSCILTISAPNVNLNFYRFSPLLARKSDDPLSLFCLMFIALLMNFCPICSLFFLFKDQF